MGRRLQLTSEFEAWRDEFLAEMNEAYGDEFAELVSQELADEVECFGTDHREFLAIISQGRAIVRRRTMQQES